MVGPNGSGKTTTIKSILNMVVPDDGSIVIFGKDHIEEMKLMLVCAFSYEARLLILDEPTSGLDPVSRDELLEILPDYIEDGRHSVLSSTHITSDLEKIADYITYLNFGKLVYTGSKDVILRFRNNDLN